MAIKKPLKGAPRLTYLAIQQFTEQGETPSQADLARATGYVVRTIKYALDRLEKEGYIKTTRQGKRNKYEILRKL